MYRMFMVTECTIIKKKKKKQVCRETVSHECCKTLLIKAFREILTMVTVT